MAKRFTLGRIALHEFNRALRIWKTLLPPLEIFKLVVEQRAKALAIVIRCFAMAGIGALWLVANKTELAIKIAFLDVSIPTSYANFFVAALLFGTLINAVNFVFINEFVRIACNKLFNFDSPWVLNVPLDGGNAWFIGGVRQFRFMSSSKAHGLFGMASVWLINLPFLAILAIIYWIVFSVGFRVLRSEGFASVGSLLTILGWLLAIYPLLLVATISIPFEFEKNTRFIRWVFLRRIYRRAGLWPPRTEFWVTPPSGANPSN